MDKKYDLNLLTNDLTKLFKSPNPLAIYLNAKEIKDKFSIILTNLTDSISKSFDLDDSQTIMNFLYRSSNYQKIWIKSFKNYILDSKDFDLIDYFSFLFLLNPNKKSLVQTLFNIKERYNLESLDNIISWYTKEEILIIYKRLNIENINFSLDDKKDLQKFLKNIYMSNKDNLVVFYKYFLIDFDTNIDFNQTKDIFYIIYNSYLQWQDFEDIKTILEAEKLKETKTQIDKLIYNFKNIRFDFYFNVNFLLRKHSVEHKNYFYSYIKTRLIEEYYSQIKNLFYINWGNDLFSKEDYSLLSSRYIYQEWFSPHIEYLNSQIDDLILLKKLIIDLNNNLFSSFLLPVIYFIVSDRVNIRKKDLAKVKYILLFMLSDNYWEYKKVFMFFNQLEVFLNYDKKVNIFSKIQISAALIFVISIFLGISYFYMPIWVSLGVILFFVVIYSEFIYPNLYFESRWNLWLKFFAILFLSISTYFWFTNVDELKKDSMEAFIYVEKLWTIKTKDALEQTWEFLKTSIFDRNKNIQK